jgi:hypothetical protein
MRFLREHLAALAVALLLMQGTSVVVSAWFSCCAEQPQSSASPMDCCKNGMSAPGQMCPMHHGQAANEQGSKEETNKRCAMRDSCSPDRTFLLSLFADVGFPMPAASIEFQHAAISPVVLAESPMGCAAVPDLPPPRL